MSAKLVESDLSSDALSSRAFHFVHSSFAFGEISDSGGIVLIVVAFSYPAFLDTANECAASATSVLQRCMSLL